MEKLTWNATLKKLRSCQLVPSLHSQEKGKLWKQWQIFFSWTPKSLRTVTAAMKLKDACLLEGKLWQTSTLKSRGITLLRKVCIVKALQASLSFTSSRSLLRFMSIESVMLSNHFIPPTPFAFNLSQHQCLSKWVSSLHQVAKVLEQRLQHQSFQWIFSPSFMIDWFDLLAVQGTLKSLF